MTTDTSQRLRPPTPDMQGRELVQWLQRVYDVLISYQTNPDPVIPPIPSSHNDLTENGGDNSHSLIAAHISAPIAHGRGSEFVSVNDTQTLVHKTINALQNTLTGLRHGVEVDDPETAHGVSGVIVGTLDAQTLVNKDIRRNITLSAGGAYSAELEDDLIICYAAAVITLPPTMVAAEGKVLTITNASAAANVLVVGSATGRLINGESEQTLPPGSSMTVVYDKHSWRII